MPSPIFENLSKTDLGATAAQLLYFTTPSITADNRHLVFVRETTAPDGSSNPNIHTLDLATREERQITRNTGGTLRSYVYFRGNPNRGLGKASICLDAPRRLVYYLQGDDICVVDFEGRVRVLNRIPTGQVTAFMHVSADGRLLCVPTTDARALDEDTPPAFAKGENIVAGQRNEIIDQKPAHDIDERVRRENLCSYLRIYDTAIGEQLACERVRQAWITHVQFSPVDSRLILYNHEWPSDCGIRRVWLWDGVKNEHRRLRTENATAMPPRSRADWACHEMWESDGAAIIYHGKYADGTAFIGRVSPAGGDNVEIALPKNFHRYGHFTIGNKHDSWLVSDGYWHPAGEAEGPTWGGEWLTRLEVDWARRSIKWTPLCRHESLWDCQDSHPHPVFSPDDTHVYYTSNAGGRRSVCRVAVPPTLTP